MDEVTSAKEGLSENQMNLGFYDYRGTGQMRNNEDYYAMYGDDQMMSTTVMTDISKEVQNQNINPYAGSYNRQDTGNDENI